MKNLRFARLILQPSLGGILGIIGFSLLLMAVSGFTYVTRNGLFYEYLFGSGSSTTLIETSRSTISLFNETVFGNPFLNKVLFFVFWMVIGLVVYVILSGVGLGASEAGKAVEESHFVHADKQRITSELRSKIILRLIAFGLIVIYLVLFLKILLPFGVLCARILAGNVGQLSSWLYGILGFTVLCGSFYIGMVLIRFFMLRPRIFGGLEDLVADEIEHSQHSA